MDEQLEHIIYLIESSDLDQTIKDILVRDLKQDGLTEFLKEQIKSYCLEDIKKTNERIEAARKILEGTNQAA